MDNNRNFYLTIALSVLIVAVWQYFYVMPRVEQQREAARIEAERAAEQQKTAPAGGAGQTPAAVPSAGTVPGQAAAVPDALTREAALKDSGRIQIDTPRLAGSVSLKGARLDDLVLKDYRVSVAKASGSVHLLNPAGLPEGYFVEVGFAGTPQSGAVPGPETIWTAPAGAKLTPQTPVTITFTNDKGLTFTREIAIDQDYMFTFTDTVANAGAAAVSVSPYGRITRSKKPDHAAAFVLHEGMLGVTGEEGLQEITFSALEESRQVQPGKSTDGWLGITDKYWAAALIPPAGTPFQPTYKWFDNAPTAYQSDYLSDPITVTPGKPATVKTQVFTGAKVSNTIDRYQEERGIRMFDRMIDWGWFYWLTKPMFWLLDNLYKLLGNFGLSILVTTVIVKGLFFPLANKSYASMARMKVVQPKMLEIREKYADDKMKQQQALMELYKTEKINPIAGCWPVLLQIPVFFALYKVLYVTIEMRHAPFFGWIQDLSAPDPTSMFNLFGLLPFEVPAFLLIGVWPLLMGITMFMQMQMNPTPPDPTQAMIFKWMPIMFTFMLATFPAGLVIYWAWNNFLSILQQAAIMKKNGAKIELWDNLKSIFRRSPKPAE